MSTTLTTAATGIDLPKEPVVERKAQTLEEVWANFDPTLAVDPATQFYIARQDDRLHSLRFELMRARGDFHAFLCGHRGSGKTTELKRLAADEEIGEKFLPIYLTIQEFGSESVHLSHDALMVEIGLALGREGKRRGMDTELHETLANWGKEIVRTFLHDEAVQAEVGAKANAWLAFFKAQLSTRREWKAEEKQILEPRVRDLIDILNLMAADLHNKSGKRVLVFVDDIEKGESEAHREMHARIFEEHYDVLMQPRFSMVYTLPIYFRAFPGSRIQPQELFAFSALRLYDQASKQEDDPPLDKNAEGYRFMRDFVESRLAEWETVFGSEAVLEKLLLIGSGLFRETARSVRDAAYLALRRGAGERITMADADAVATRIKKEYQPMIRGEAVKVLKEVLASTEGWVPGVEPFLQNRAVVEYENGDLWLDLRSLLKPYVRKLQIPSPAPS